ncbi:uncharacterized protein LOC120346347 [Styela clava]
MDTTASTTPSIPHDKHFILIVVATCSGILFMASIIMLICCIQKRNRLRKNAKEREVNTTKTDLPKTDETILSLEHMTAHHVVESPFQTDAVLYSTIDDMATSGKGRLLVKNVLYEENSSGITNPEIVNNIIYSMDENTATNGDHVNNDDNGQHMVDNVLYGTNVAQ